MPAPAHAPQSGKTQRKQTVFTAFTDTYMEARARRDARRAGRRSKPPPWILQKFFVALVLALFLWSEYVYTGRLCVPMIRGDADARGGRSQGIGYLVVFQILWLLCVWAYLKVILTSPGFARDYIKKTLHPNEELAGPHEARPGSIDTGTGTASPFQRVSDDLVRPLTPATAEKQRRPHSPYHTQRSKNGPTEIPENNPMARSFQGPMELDAVPVIAVPRAAVMNGNSLKRPEPAVRPSWDAPTSNGTAEPYTQSQCMRRPPSHPALAPDKRYCYKDEIVKPYRCHHCSTCGTDILAFDHHCFWVGQCVGARNRKFFVNFLEWAFAFTAFTFVTLIIANVDLSWLETPDGQELAILVFTGFFMVFTLMLLTSHIWLLSINATTVEHLSMQRMKQRERSLLNEMHPWWNLRAKRRTLKQWDQEWGKITTEGNIWWLGSSLACWEATMGANPVWWFFPIGRSQSDGLSYPVNPRFTPDGRWRRRSEWPAELR